MLKRPYGLTEEFHTENNTESSTDHANSLVKVHEEKELESVSRQKLKRLVKGVDRAAGVPRSRFLRGLLDDAIRAYRVYQPDENQLKLF